MVHSVKGSVLWWVLFLILFSIPAYFALGPVRRFFSDQPLASSSNSEAERLKQARVEEFVRRHPKPAPAPLAAFKDEEEKKPAPEEKTKPADEFADLRQLNEAQKRALTKEHLYLIRGAVYQYQNEQGKCPAKLEDLVPEYLQDMPPALIPGPLGTISKKVYNTPDGRLAVTGDGGWSYNADKTHAKRCSVRPNSALYNTPGADPWDAGN